MDGLNWGDTPTLGDPLHGWPVFSVVGAGYWLEDDDIVDLGKIARRIGLRREDEEIILILANIIKEL